MCGVFTPRAPRGVMRGARSPALSTSSSRSAAIYCHYCRKRQCSGSRVGGESLSSRRAICPNRTIRIKATMTQVAKCMTTVIFLFIISEVFLILFFHSSFLIILILKNKSMLFLGYLTSSPALVDPIKQTISIYQRSDTAQLSANSVDIKTVKFAVIKLTGGFQFLY